MSPHERVQEEVGLENGWMNGGLNVFFSVNNLKVGASSPLTSCKAPAHDHTILYPSFSSRSADDNVAFTLPTGSNPPPPPLPPIMSCFPTVGEQDRNGCRSAKTEMREGGEEGAGERGGGSGGDGGMEESGDESNGREIDVKWWVIEGRRKCEWTR